MSKFRSFRYDRNEPKTHSPDTYTPNPGCATTQQVTSGGEGGPLPPKGGAPRRRQRRRWGRGARGPLPAPAPNSDAPHSNVRTAPARCDPARCGPRADHARPGQRLGPSAGRSRSRPPALPQARRRASRRSPRGPPRPHGPVPYQLGGEPGRPSGIEKSRHWEVLGEGGAGLKGTTTSFHWGVAGRGRTEEAPKPERNGMGRTLSCWVRAGSTSRLTLCPTLHPSQEKKSPSVAWGSRDSFPRSQRVWKD